jgi:hypothetical protein
LNVEFSRHASWAPGATKLISIFFCNVDDFVGGKSPHETPGGNFRYISPNVTRVIEFDSERGVQLPLEAACERTNCTLEGRSEGACSKIDPRVPFAMIKSGEVPTASLSAATDVELGACASGATAKPTSGADVVPEPSPVSPPNVEPVRKACVDSLGRRYPCDEFGHRIKPN